MNVTQRQLEGATGFDEGNWPNFAGRNFTDDLYPRYNVNGVTGKSMSMSAAEAWTLTYK